MKIEKNKIVFAIVILCVVLFIASYSAILLGKDEGSIIENNQIPIPRLKDEQKEYESKLDALNSLKEVRQTNAPSVYDEHLLDSAGVYDIDLLEKEKRRIVDSIYNEGRISYTDRTFRKPKVKVLPKVVKRDTISKTVEKGISIAIKELSLEHQLFFASKPIENEELNIQSKEVAIFVRVDGTQTVKKNFRLQMRLEKDAMINNILFTKNTLIYGFVSFKPNRTIIKIENINQQPVKLKAFDLQDGCEGVYIKNSFRAQAKQEVMGDIVDDINVVGVPQIAGIKKIFQHNNKNIKATIANNYKLILKQKP